MTPKSEMHLPRPSRQRRRRRLCTSRAAVRAQAWAAGVTGEVLNTTGLKGVSLYEPGALTIVAAAGTPLETVEKALAKENQRLAFEPMDHRALYGTNGKPTIGGVVAANVSGPRRIQAGAARDALIGVRFVNGEGTVIKNGGRVMKNVTGYDLVKLMAGSHGTLGVLTEVAFKVLPNAGDIGADFGVRARRCRAVEAMSAALTSPYDVTGAAHLAGGTARTMIRIEGFEGSVKYRAERLQDLLGRFGDVDVSLNDKANSQAWIDVRDVKLVADGQGDVWRISVKPSDGPAVIKSLPSGAAVQMDWGGGLVWARVPEGTDVRKGLKGIEGHATLVRADEATKGKLGVFQPEQPALAAISNGLRAKFDPHGNPQPRTHGITGRCKPISPSSRCATP
jgi:glycolate oxidase FAD binding subunit